MPQIKCDWDACECNIEGFCKCLGTISLKQNIGLRKEYLECENFRYQKNPEMEVEVTEDEN